ncbi:hypothetical protein B0H13DRAFT_105402 [Mycena leptocephala]|nr:hypothetical protein B0H13DRAFT_105402 [Mycena leptocephala]
MYSPSLASSDGNSRHSSTCSCGRGIDSPDSLYRTTTRASSGSTSDFGSQPSKMRYGGRGGAGSRPRTLPPRPPIAEGEKLTPVVSDSLPQSQSANFKTKWLNRVASSDALEDNPPATPVSSLAGRRGATNVPPPLILRAASPQIVSGLTPPLSALSTTSNSTATDSEFSPTPRSPYFYFDEAFDSRHVRGDSPLPSPAASGTMSRSLRRLASRTQEFFSRDPFHKAPPPTPTSPTHGLVPPPPLTSPSVTSVATSEWFDTPDSVETDEFLIYPTPLRLLPRSSSSFPYLRGVPALPQSSPSPARHGRANTKANGGSASRGRTGTGIGKTWGRSSWRCACSNEMV